MKKPTSMPIIKTLEKYRHQNPIRFHMPGHKGKGLGKKASKVFKDNLFSWDITEIPGFDDLHQPMGIINEAQEHLANLYNADKSYFLVNGATSGILAMMGAALMPKDTIILSRASHKAVLSGLVLTGASPVYVMPELDTNLGVYTQITPKALSDISKKNSQSKAVLVANPVYQGFCPDLRGICQVLQKTDNLLLVDEAHGPHLGFSPKLPKSASNYRVDAWVQSPHKMLSSFTQSAWLHIKGNHIDKDRVQEYLQMVTSSSPSYILMASLDFARALMERKGKALLEKTLYMAKIARQHINTKTPFYCVGTEIKGQKGIYDIDLSRLMVNVSKAGYTGYDVDKILRQRFNIYPEYSDFYNVYFLISLGNTKEDIEQLMCALSCFRKKGKPKSFTPLPKSLPQKIMEPRQAFYTKGQYIALKNARGRIAKQPLVPYPPGIPMIMPGEVIEDIHIDMILNILSAGGSCQGVKQQNKVSVIME